MLNIGKFQNNFKITIQGGLKQVHEWTENGEGEYCFTSGMEYYNGSFDVDIDNISAIGKLIVEHINKCNYTKFAEKDFSVIDNRITWNQIEDNGCNVLSPEEQETEERQYICDYDVFVSINGIELEEEELLELLPEAIY